MPSILFIEDEEALRRILCGVLADVGYDVREADNGRSGLNQLREDPVDLVITDIVMPEIDGIEVVQVVRRLYPATKIIAMAGGSPSSAQCYLKMARLLGADAVLAKPFTAAKLLAAVRKVL
jgi:CheY-like chemotaxis protein